MNYANIKTNDISNGIGIRTSIFVSGCRLRCDGCFNFKAWKFTYGDVFTDDVKNSILDSLSPSYIDGLSILGGEPMEPENQEGILPLIKSVKHKYPDKNIWLYTGYTFDDFLIGGSRHTKYTDSILKMVDVLVDGKFIKSLKKVGLKFRGSSNQRLIDSKLSINTGIVVEIEL